MGRESVSLGIWTTDKRCDMISYVVGRAEVPLLVRNHQFWVLFHVSYYVVYNKLFNSFNALEMIVQSQLGSMVCLKLLI